MLKSFKVVIYMVYKKHAAMRKAQPHMPLCDALFYPPHYNPKSARSVYFFTCCRCHIGMMIWRSNPSSTMFPQQAASLPAALMNGTGWIRRYSAIKVYRPEVCPPHILSAEREIVIDGNADHADAPHHYQQTQIPPACGGSFHYIRARVASILYKSK